MKARLIGNQSKHGWCHFSIAITLCNQYLLHNDKLKQKSFLFPPYSIYTETVGWMFCINRYFSYKYSFHSIKLPGQSIKVIKVLPLFPRNNLGHLFTDCANMLNTVTQTQHELFTACTCWVDKEYLYKLGSNSVTTKKYYFSECHKHSKNCFCYQNLIRSNRHFKRSLRKSYH